MRAALPPASRLPAPANAHWRCPPPPRLARRACPRPAGLLSLSPDSLVDQQCELLGALLQAWPPHACAQWLSAAFQHEAVRAAASAGGEEGAPLFLQLLAHRPPLRHGAIAREFAAMCRREGGSVGLRQFVPTA